MALPTFPSSFPFSPPTPPSRRPTTEINLSRWHNANAEPFLRRRRHQESIERDLRLHRRYDSADRLADVPTPSSPPSPSPSPKSLGTPSSPSKRSIPGRKSKYSKPPDRDSDHSHPAFRSVRQTVRRLPVPEGGSESVVRVGEKGISYKFEDAPFEFQYSYTETPKVKPLALRETVYLPFGPSTMPRPWTGRAPLPPSKKKLPEFDSFRPPPAGKKGVKPVQNPGPFLAGSGPKYSAGTREEVLGEPLTKDEVKDMVRGCLRTTRQLNIGRDGLTHNMLDNIHAHWKRRRVCKIKCKGVCTVDMDNVRQQLEEKTGGKVIYSKGGVIFLFRGRNYNDKTRPRYPLMLWKPTPPVYPKLVPRVPEGLTLEEATKMRNKGRDLPPICKLGKNGVYVNLVNNVKEAFEECELVRINCQGLNKSDCRKIGAKLKDLVPCVLISFEYEHILMWRGREWKSSLPSSDNPVEAAEPAASISVESPPSSADSSQADNQDLVESHVVTVLSKDGLSFEVAHEISLETGGATNESKEEFDKEVAQPLPDAPPAEPNYLEGDKVHSDDINCTNINDFASRKSPKDTHHLEMHSGKISMTQKNEMEVRNNFEINSQAPDYSCAKSSNINTGNEKQRILNSTGSPQALDYLSTQSSISNIESDEHGTPNSTSTGSLQRPYLEGVMLLLKQAIDEGCALLLDNNSLDANIVYEKAVDLAKTAPAAPIFRHQIRKQTKKKVTGVGKESNEDMKVEDTTKPEKLSSEKKKPKSQKEHFRGEFPSVVPHGSLNVDELAKLLNT